MNSAFQFALKNVQASQWQPFENLASQFLADEFTSLRTLASPSGDLGRDAILHQPEGDSEVVIQYSVSADWESKIRRTIRQVSTEHPGVSVLIFVSPKQIAARADDLRTSARRESEMHLDIRDQHWFVERENRSDATSRAASWFTDLVVGDVLRDERLIDRSASVLTSEETRAALLYLVLQREDDDLDRHLTKLCYDALVRAVLRHSDSDNRKSRVQIHEEVCALLPTHDAATVTQYVDRALDRMNKRFTRHWVKTDEFCLTHEERERLASGIARLRLLDDGFEEELMSNGRLVANGLALDLSVVDSDQITTRMRRVLEAFLLERGEAFVASLTSGQAMMFVEEELEGLVERDLASHPDATSLRGSVVPLVAQTLHRVLLSPSEQVRTYLRAVADGYTLFAFLRETPNVQSAVSKLFANGEIWLDTSALLPVMAEDLLEEAERGYSQLLHAVVTSGGKLYVTSGVLEEISSHIDNSIAASRSPKTWNSRTPFLLASYTWAGHAATGFSSWVETFRGQSRPIDDLEEYLAEVHGIRLVDLIADYQRADENVRWQTDAHWQEVHERRRSRTSEQRADPDVIRQLAAHDAENFLGVIQRRSGEQIGNPFGYSTWWLTLDRRAAEAASAIAERCQLERLDSPVLSFDFLAYYLAVGPARRQLAKSSEQQLPLITDTSLIDALPADLLSAADRIRASMEGQDERLIRRRIRDHLDEEKLRDDRVGRTTIDAIEFDIRMALQSSPSRGRRVGS